MERFERGRDGIVRRSNEIWRTGTLRSTGDVVGRELVRRNRAVVKYDVAAARIQDMAADSCDTSSRVS